MQGCVSRGCYARVCARVCVTRLLCKGVCHEVVMQGCVSPGSYARGVCLDVVMMGVYHEVVIQGCVSCDW